MYLSAICMKLFDLICLQLHNVKTESRVFLFYVLINLIKTLTASTIEAIEKIQPRIVLFANKEKKSMFIMSHL